MSDGTEGGRKIMQKRNRLKYIVVGGWGGGVKGIEGGKMRKDRRVIRGTRSSEEEGDWL